MPDGAANHRIVFNEEQAHRSVASRLFPATTRSSCKRSLYGAPVEAETPPANAAGRTCLDVCAIVNFIIAASAELGAIQIDPMASRGEPRTHGVDMFAEARQIRRDGAHRVQTAL